MNISKARAPYIKTGAPAFDGAVDMLIALVPIIIWSVYIFGARVITLCLTEAIFCIALDAAFRLFFLKKGIKKSFDPYAAAYGILAAFTLPVSAPMWAPVLSAAFTVLAKNLRYTRGRRLFSPFVFSAAAMNLIFPETMQTFTRPRAYFNAFAFRLDPALVERYRVISPLEYIKDGDVYEAGALPQLFGYASGHIGEIAVAAIAFAGIWLFIRRRADIRFTAAMLVSIFFLSLIFPSDDAESNYFAYSLLFSGAVIYLSVFVPAEGSTVPATRNGRLIFGCAAGVLIFVARKFFGGFEWEYFIILLLGLLTPVIERFTLPKPCGNTKKS